MKLNQAEINTPLWNKLKEHYSMVIAKHRSRLENPRITESERIELCWKISSIKEFFEMGEPDRKK